MKRLIEIEVEIPEGYSFEAYRPPKVGEPFIHPLTRSLRTFRHDDTEIKSPVVVLKKIKRILRTYELVSPSDHAKVGDNYSKLVNGPISLWGFSAPSAAFFYIWKEVKLDKQSEENGEQNGEQNGN